MTKAAETTGKGSRPDRTGFRGSAAGIVSAPNRPIGPVTGAFNMPNGDRLHFVRRDVFERAVDSNPQGAISVKK